MVGIKICQSIRSMNGNMNLINMLSNRSVVYNLWFENKVNKEKLEKVFKDAIIQFKSFLNCILIDYSEETTTYENINWLRNILN
jgi:hypothetical protein